MFSVIDLFAGAGGLSSGFEMAGFNVLLANELSPVFSESLRYNHSRSEVLTSDIRDIDSTVVRKSLGLKKGELDVLVGGPPCQGFSVNAPVRSVEDERNHLFLDYLKFVESFKPKFVVIENVPGMLSFEKGQTVKAILASLKSLGYDVAVRVLYAPNFGVPQMRWRTFFIANNLGLNSLTVFPKAIYSVKGRANFTSSVDKESLLLNDEFFDQAIDGYVSIKDAIFDLPEISNKGGEDVLKHEISLPNKYVSQLRASSSEPLYNHVCAGLGKANLDRLPYIPQGGSWRDIPFELLPEGMKRARRSDHTQRYGRLSWDGLGSTILTKCDPHWGRFIHPQQDRVISVREAARIQSFPDRCRFFGKLADQYMQVGNAVPPLLAKAIAVQIKTAINEPSKLSLNKRQKAFEFV